MHYYYPLRSKLKIPKYYTKPVTPILLEINVFILNLGGLIFFQLMELNFYYHFLQYFLERRIVYEERRDWRF